MKTYFLAHVGESVEEHTEDMESAPHDVAQVDPIYIGGAVVAVVIIGFLFWKFLMKK